MGIFDIFRKKVKETGSAEVVPDEKVEDIVDRSRWTGKDFEFFIRGDIEISADEFDELMTPQTLTWDRVVRDNWVYYKVGEDEFSYSIEPPGIQMTFNKSMPYAKAKQIADEVINKIKGTGQEAKLVIINSNTLYKF